MSSNKTHDLLDNGRTKAALESAGFKVYVSSPHSLEAGNGVFVLQVIQLDNGEYRVSKLPQSEVNKISKNVQVLPELGEVKKWLNAESGAA